MVTHISKDEMLLIYNIINNNNNKIYIYIYIS